MNSDVKNAQAELTSNDIELRKVLLEERKFEAEKIGQDRTYDLQKKESDARLAESSWSHLKHPLTLGIVAAFIAGAASIVSQYISGQNQINANAILGQNQITAAKEAHAADMQTEAYKAEAGRIIEAIRSGDPDKAACNLRFLLDIGLVSTPNLREKIADYITVRNGGTGVSTGSQVAAAAIPAQVSTTTICQTISVVSRETIVGNTAPASTKPAELIVPWQSEWMGGGNNQQAQCERAIRELQLRFPGRTLKTVSSTEESNKRLLGRVEYRYYCNIQVI